MVHGLNRSPGPGAWDDIPARRMFEPGDDHPDDGQPELRVIEIDDKDFRESGVMEPIEKPSEIGFIRLATEARPGAELEIFHSKRTVGSAMARPVRAQRRRMVPS